MISQERPSIRQVRQTDERQITNLVQFGTYVHQHLDWCQPVEWIGHQPYLVAEWNFGLLAALACPPDPENIAWIRLFAVNSIISVQEAWRTLWAVVCEQLSSSDMIVAAIPIKEWFQGVLESSHFEHTNDVVMLKWERSKSNPTLIEPAFKIRNMESEDIAAVREVDRQAFSPIWQNSKTLLEIARTKAAIATVVENQDGILGYQISTASPMGGHLARLAVLPRWQGCGVGFALVRHVLNQFQLWGSLRVTVNTQSDNAASLALYEKVGFQRTNEAFPVYQLTLSK
jgi:ribosomal protein S18 acetylase RimI-like enzyme